MAVQLPVKSGMDEIQRSSRRLFFLLPLLPVSIHAATLGSPTLAAWDEYVQSASIENERRASSGERFFWIDEAPDRTAKLRAGEIVVSAAGPQIPKRVPSGLIHDWVGAVFIPRASLHDVFGVARDYSHYKDWFQSAVAESRAIPSTKASDRFSMLLVNRSFFKKMALDTEYESRYIRIDDCREYSIARTTRIQEVEEYGAPGQHVLPEGEGAGIIWRLLTITRYVERDGGVYIEIQAIGLSRDIPASLRWIVEPIVRRVSRASLATSLRQTASAVRMSLDSVEVSARKSSPRVRSRPQKVRGGLWRQANSPQDYGSRFLRSPGVDLSSFSFCRPVNLEKR